MNTNTCKISVINYPKTLLKRTFYCFVFGLNF